MSYERPRYFDCQTFAFSDQERMYYIVSDERFQTFVNDDETIIAKVESKPSYYGNFLYITLSRHWQSQPELVTFYGLGQHLQQQRWYHQSWIWHIQHPMSTVIQQTLSKNSLQQIIERRRRTIAPYISDYVDAKQDELDALIINLRTSPNPITQSKILRTIDDLWA